MQKHKTAKGISCNLIFMLIGSRNQTNQALRLIESSTTKIFGVCERKVIYLGPRPFVCDVILCEQHRQVNLNTDSCYVTAAFSIVSYCGYSGPRMLIRLRI